MLTHGFSHINLFGMANRNTTLDIPKNPADRRAWIMWQLRRRGLSFAALSRAVGLSTEAVRRAADGGVSEARERQIAAAIKVPVQALYPEYYDRSGHRIRLVKATNCKAEGTRPAPQRNGENEEAA